MNLVELKRVTKREDVVKLSYCTNYASRSTKEKVWRCYLFIGSAIVSKLNWKGRDYTKILCGTDEKGSHVFNIKKIYDNDPSEYKLFKGFKLLPVARSNSYAVNFISDKQDEIGKMTNEERAIRTLRHEIVQDKDGDYLKVWYGEWK